jgi:hypothetical protein
LGTLFAISLISPGSLLSVLVSLGGLTSWSGHGVLIGRSKNDWQEKDYVLRQSGETEGKATRAYTAVAKAVQTFEAKG